MILLGKLISSCVGLENLILMTVKDGEKLAHAELWHGQEKLDHQIRHKQDKIIHFLTSENREVNFQEVAELW